MRLRFETWKIILTMPGPIHGNLLASLNNGAIDLGGDARYTEAVEILNRGLAMDATYATFKTNYLHLYHQWTEDLCRQQRFDEAAELLAKAAWSHLDQAWFRQARAAIYGRWAGSAREAGRSEEASRILVTAQQQLGAVPETCSPAP